MSIPELATPIRLYWDITPLPAVLPDYNKIVTDIIDLKILSVDIKAAGLKVPAELFSPLIRLSAARISVTLTLSPEGLSPATVAAMTANPPKELLLEIGDISDLESLPTALLTIAGISFPLNNDNWQQIPELIGNCAKLRLYRLVFPMQRLYAGEAPFHIPLDGRAEISAAMLAEPPAAEMRITAHDPFVWRAIFPSTPFPNGRCQAANTMLSIDSSGTVYPCPVMPVPLGDLQTASLKEVARSTAKKALRNILLKLPQECCGCPDAETCKGGCRGRGERISGTWEGIDPGCR